MTDSIQRTTLSALVLGLALTGCGSEPGAIVDCTPADGITPVCGFENPEDLAILPGGTWVLVSQFPGVQGGGIGSLVAYRPADGRRLSLFPDDDPDASVDLDSEAPAPAGSRTQAQAQAQGWGSADCPGPPDPARFGPHGLDLDAGAHRLAVVNHGDREAVELFEVGHSRRGPAIVWRGCVPIPEDAWGNDVSLLPDGSFFLTRMLGATGLSRTWSVVRMLTGGNTGYVLAWTPEAGFRRIPGSDTAAPNGIVASADGRDLYVAEWSGSRLVRLRLDAAGDVADRDSVELPHHPDNITRTRDGELLVTGQIGPIGALLACGSTEEGTCALPFSVLRVAPGTLDVRVVLEHDPAVAHGAGTVALAFGDEIFIGTFDGDRIGRAAFDH